MGGDYSVRAAGPDDCSLIVDFNRAMAMETEGHDLNEGTVVAGVTAVLADPAKGRYFIAERRRAAPEAEGQRAAPPEPAGQLMITLEWSDWRNGPIWPSPIRGRPRLRLFGARGTLPGGFFAAAINGRSAPIETTTAWRPVRV